ncbi:MAG TPA: hypothetical protein VLX92_19270 [Kofleriaceae bacterium]|nr:hypothetical protein [Kofleriaceae bacterium]
MTRRAVLALLCGCTRLQGLGGAPPALATFDVTASGTLLPAPVNLSLALVWGKQWLVEPLCIVPDDPRDAANQAQIDTVKAAGCRDPFGFVPARVAASVPVALGTGSTIELVTVPNDDVMVGDLTARVAYGSFVLYDDVDGNGTIDLARPNRLDTEAMKGDQPYTTPDHIFGASFVAMTLPDQRVAYREGGFDETAAFYPRAGCGDPLPGFSVVAASGFTEQSAIAATLAGMLPSETDLSQCAQAAPQDAPVAFTVSPLAPPLVPPALDVPELACTERTADSSVTYHKPGMNPPDLTKRQSACVHYPSFGMPSDVIEWVVTGRSDDSCVGLTHYILKGCASGPECASPDWDETAAPPTWWPC